MEAAVKMIWKKQNGNIDIIDLKWHTLNSQKILGVIVDFERRYVTGSPMAEVLHENLAEIESSDVHKRLGLEKGKYILLSGS